MSVTIQWCDGPSPSVKRPVAHRLGRQRLLRHRDRVPGLDRHDRGAELDPRVVAVPISAIAVSASKSSGICGTQIEAKPACSAASASATSCADLVAVPPPLGADHQTDPHLATLEPT